jgi:ArsR family transcriptional regulator, arsenate/arsenite/antimonite-responsive transcriptional repressor
MLNAQCSTLNASPKNISHFVETYGIVISTMNEMTNRAKALKALGDPTRLRIVEFLGCCPQALDVEQDGAVRATEGPTAGEVCCHITGGEKITSTISHHLHELRDAGLIRIERKGKCMMCTLEREAIGDLAQYLTGLSQGDQNGCC